MSYSVFEKTMADMTYPEVERAAARKLPLLFPLGVIEEHGPHMCLGVDTYLAYKVCRLVGDGLSGLGCESLMVPPLYWGVNSATQAFAGSFTVKPETLISVLCDTLECLKTWGFDDIFLVNLHGDLQQNLTILEAARKAHEELGVGVHFVLPDFLLGRAQLSEIKPYMMVIPSRPLAQAEDSPQAFLDVHAGGLETSLMLADFPELVDLEKAKALGSSRTTLAGLMAWEQGGEGAREVTPLGYLGNPSDINLEAARAFEAGMAATLARFVFELRGKTS